MANKYFIFGATYNGDGTTSSEAASDGAAGAWNQTSILTGTAPAYGALAAEDVVYIRSKTSAGADPTLVLASGANIGYSNAGLITWVLDNGQIWSGIDGSLSFTYAPTAGAWGLRNNNKFVASRREAWSIRASSDTNNACSPVFNSAVVIGLVFDYSIKGSSNTSVANWVINGARVEECRFIFGRVSTSHRIYIYPASFPQLINCTYELTANSRTAGSLFAFNTAANDQVYGIVHGGQIVGDAAAIDACNLFGESTNGHFQFIGLKFPKTLNLYSYHNSSNFVATDVFGCDGYMGAAKVRMWGNASFRDDVAQPYLNATLPGVATGWSWLIYVATLSRGNGLVELAKVYQDTAAVKKITTELLIQEDYELTINRSNLWVTVSYIDNTTGLVKSASSQPVVYSTAPLASSSAAWSSSSYGADLFVKRKIEITTPTSIKQNTLVHILVHIAEVAGDGSQRIFLCPDPQLGAP